MIYTAFCVQRSTSGFEKLVIALCLLGGFLSGCTGMFNNPSSLPLSAPNDFNVVVQPTTATSNTALTTGVSLKWETQDASVSFTVKYGVQSKHYDTP